MGMNVDEGEDGGLVGRTLRMEMACLTFYHNYACF